MGYNLVDLDQHHVKVSGAKFLDSRMLNQARAQGDKIPLSSSLKGKELALNWGRQNINHTQRVLLSIHHIDTNWKGSTRQKY